MWLVRHGGENVKESTIEKKLVYGVRRFGWRALKFISPGNDGVPDRIVLGPVGRVVFVELKTDDGKLTRLQENQIGKLRKLGMDVRVLYGAKDVEGFLQEIASYARASR